jgi:GTP-binding protein
MSSSVKSRPVVANPLLRNVAIVAHVDHGKTTLVDAMLHQSGIFRANERVVDRVMDSNDLERERGITILAKNTAVHYHETLINIVDTPGHADFGGEVERTLAMVDGIVLLVDASEGPLPQTRFVLRKALERRLVPVVVINKIDRPDARSKEVLTRSTTSSSIWTPPRSRSTSRSSTPARARAPPAPISRCLERSASAVRRDPVLRAAAARRSGRAVAAARHESRRERLPRPDRDRPHLQRPDLGRRSGRGAQARRQHQETKITKLYSFEGLKRVDIATAAAGEIVCIAGIEDITIGETVADIEQRVAITPIAVDEPTVSMIFGVNTSPMAGRDGQCVTSRNLKERLDKELLGNVSVRVEPTETPEQIKVIGRGELQLSILIEMMRREASRVRCRPEIVTKEIDGKRVEPVEDLIIDVRGLQGVRHRAARHAQGRDDRRW